jgi:DNA-binding response OmpR family regulator
VSDLQIWVVEDEPSVGEVVSLYLQKAGFLVRVLQDGLEAVRALEKQIPDLLILDLMLPGVGGLEIARGLRQRSEVPIIMLTARGQEIDRIGGFEMGADDYVVKPFSPQELVSRVRAVLRRSHLIPEVQEQPVVAGDLRIDPQTHKVLVDDLEKELTAREFDLLWLLASHPRQVFNRSQLLSRVWGVADYIDPGTITVHIRRLREKIELDPANPSHLQTVWGVGYKFEP